MLRLTVKDWRTIFSTKKRFNYFPKTTTLFFYNSVNIFRFRIVYSLKYKFATTVILTWIASQARTVYTEEEWFKALHSTKYKTKWPTAQKGNIYDAFSQNRFWSQLRKNYTYFPMPVDVSEISARLMNPVNSVRNFIIRIHLHRQIYVYIYKAQAYTSKT